VHYPSDVVAAWAAALAWVVGLRLILLARAAGPRATTRPLRARRMIPRTERRWYLRGRRSGTATWRPFQGR